MLNIYNRIVETEFVFGQDARTKEWYCKELRAKTVKEAGTRMGEANRICNQYNKKKVSPSTPPSIKEKEPNVKGLS